MEEIITLVLTIRGNRRIQVDLLWIEGKQLRGYLKDPVLTPYGTIEIALKSRVTNQDFKKVRLSDPLHAGDIIFMKRVR